MSYLTQQELDSMGFMRVGKHVLLSDKASVYNPAKIELGDNCRIDDFCILSAGDGGIEIGDYVHISCHSTLLGKGLISIGNFSSLSSYGCILSSNDNWSGEWMVGPCIPDELRKVDNSPVVVKECVAIGAHSIVMPGCVLNDGCAIGAHSFVPPGTATRPLTIYAGVPARAIKERNAKHLTIAIEFMKSVHNVD